MKLRMLLGIAVCALLLGATSSTFKAQFSIEPKAVEVNDVVQFTCKTTTATQWAWTFGDGDGSMEQNPAHVFKAVGWTKVALMVSDGTLIDSVAGYLYIFPELICDFTWTPEIPVETVEMQFFDRSSGYNIVRWLWDFGDGAGSGRRNPRHTFVKAGKYVITLTVTNDFGKTRSRSASMEL